MTSESLPLLIIDHDGTLFGSAVRDWDISTLVSCMSEDVANWSEVPLVWPRYQDTVSSESCDALHLQRCNHTDATTQLGTDQPWAAIDMVHKRIFGGGGYDEFAHKIDWGYDNDDGRVWIPVRLPVWWEVFNNATIAQLNQPRDTPINVPDSRRDVLWGREWTSAIAKLMLQTARGSKWRDACVEQDNRALHKMTIAVHRDWLMTRRADLGDRMPRQCLHGGRTWIESLIDLRRHNMTLDRQQIRLSPDLGTFKNGPMGRDEICTYFDANRHLIAVGWQWIMSHPEKFAANNGQDELAKNLEEEKQAWLDSPLEGDSPPAVIVLCERQRVPHIMTFDADHVVDDDCPICLMMANNEFGPTFVMYDGHHLELDDEFAFSLCESRSDWEKQQGEFDEMKKQIESEVVVNDDKRVDEVDSVWKTSYVNWDETDGTAMETMAVGFLLAEIVGAMQEKGVPRSEIQSVNTAFLKYRSKVPRNPRKAAKEFKKTLQLVALRHNDLVSRSADLQSKLDELNRR